MDACSQRGQVISRCGFRGTKSVMIINYSGDLIDSANVECNEIIKSNIQCKEAPRRDNIII